MTHHAFVEHVLGNGPLRTRLETPHTDQELTALAAEAGFTLEAHQLSEVRAALGRELRGELSEEELLQVAGGLGPFSPAHESGLVLPPMASSI